MAVVRTGPTAHDDLAAGTGRPDTAASRCGDQVMGGATTLPMEVLDQL